MKKLLLIDSHSLLHRAFHAIPPLTSAEGRASNALYGVASMLIKTLREEAPDYVAVLRDLPQPTFRKQEYEAYKGTRPKAPDELVSQLTRAPELFSAFGLTVFEAPGFEADDLIATFVDRFAGADMRIVIVTGDMDTLQLVAGDGVLVKTPKKGVGDFSLFDEEAVETKYGISPGQVVDYKALVGDPSDNVKGVPGIGPKTASEILKAYGTVEKFFDHGIREKKYEKFTAFKEAALMAKHLVTLKRDVPIPRPFLEDLAYHDVPEEVAAYCRTMGFKSILGRIGARPAEISVKKPKKEAKKTQSLF